MRQSHKILVASMALLATCLAGCSYVEKIRDGKTAFERKRYYQAAEMLQDEFRAARSNIEQMNIAYLIGECNLKFNNITEATKWFKTAYEGGYGSNALVAYASCLKRAERYEEAANAYLRVGDEIGDRIKYRREIANCWQAVDWRDDERYSPYKVEPLGINSRYSDYSPVPLSANEVVFTSDRPESIGEYTYAWTGNDFSDLYVANVGNKDVKEFQSGLNSDDNEGTATLSQDGEKMIFCRCFSRDDYDVHCKLLITTKDNGRWARPEVLPFVTDEFNYRQPAFANGDTSLIFSADIDGSTNLYDLYISHLTDGEWSEPVPLSKRINTQSREGFPFMHQDTLYFASDYAGMGGLDIYKTYIMSNGQWAPPINLEAPVNSGADDFAFVVNEFEVATDSVLQAGYFTSSRDGGQGFDDIYRFEKRRYVPERPPEPEEVFEYEIVLDLRVFQREYEDPEDPNSRVIMRVPLADADISITEDGAQFKDMASDIYGMLTLKLNPEKDYEFFASHDGFFNNQLVFSTKDLPIDSSKKEQRFEERLLLEKIFYEKEVVLENIYYDLDESFIREDAKPTLNELADLLKLNPQINIQLSSHTDCRAGDEYNLNLSQDRAESAVRYLIEQGIATERMVPKGYGETQLAIDCECDSCTEEEHQANRRTTFRVTETP